MMRRQRGGGDRVLSSEMVSLSERLSRMLLVRLGCVVVVFGSFAFGVKMANTGVNLLLLSGLYIFLSLSIEGLRRWSGNRGLFLISAMLLVDGVYLAWTTYASGGAQSPLRILLYVHLIAVTLLASYRTGLKIALWHSLLLFVGFYSQLAGFIERVGTEWGVGGDITSQFHRMSVYNVTAFWAVALGTAVCSALNERELRRRGVDLEALAEMATDLDNASDTEAAAQRLIDATSDAFAFPRAAVIVDLGDRIGIPAHRGCAEAPEDLDTIDWAIDLAWRERKPEVIEWFDPQANPHLAKMFEGARQLVIVPLIAEGSRMGALVAEVSPRRRYRMDSRVLAMLEQFALHAALALSNVKLLQQVQKLAETDSLTGIWNRMMFDQMLRKEVNRAQRSNTTFALVMLDIDHFKQLNDTYGHQAGDDVLRRLAQSLVSNARDFDIVSRYGGEEFTVILPEVDVHEAAQIAERLRGVVSEVEAPVRITASFGIALYPNSGTSEADVIRAADEAMYISKRAGRDCVTAASSNEPFDTAALQDMVVPE
jgi:diguanylate cyclase (GGDEF)-like protein